ncbi:MAG: endonuclease MutS2, partial [Muribaculaceae bacterium]|nr:endonuclease MutS2 [Muribaculaceae bacterium]
IVERRLRETAEMLSLITGAEGFSLGSIADVSTILARTKAMGTFLAPDELLQINTSLTTANSLADFFGQRRDEDGRSRYPLLDVHAIQLGYFPHVTAIINRTIDRFGEIKDSASPELGQIRRQISSTQASLSAVMRRVMSRAIEGGYLEADATPTVRDGRLVLPVSPMNKRKINGIVHDESASGKTFFIEPAELVEANNRIRELQIEEKREIARILKEVTDLIRPDSELIVATVEILGIFDFIRAKALYAKEIEAQMPHLEPVAEIDWYHAVHPVLLLSLRKQGKEIVPLDIRLTKRDRILMISGPNAGGKSVCLKTVGIVQYMTQVGLLPPVYENSHIGIFDNIFIDIGDDQSIEDDLSTYSSHLRNMKFFLARGNASTLLLIDEFGGGTEPLIGGAIAQAILKNFNEKGMWGVITTHYQNLKNFADDTPGLTNGSMLYD